MLYHDKDIRKVQEITLGNSEFYSNPHAHRDKISVLLFGELVDTVLPKNVAKITGNAKAERTSKPRITTAFDFKFITNDIIQLN